MSFLEDDDKSVNTMGKHIKNLKTILNSALEEGVNQYVYFKHKDFKVVSEKTVAVYLTEEEIEQIKNLELRYNKGLELSRDIFLMGYYTGQRVSDYNGLDYKDIFVKEGVHFIKIRQEKTGSTIECPITVEMKEVMDSRHEGKFPIKRSDQKINKDLKEIGELAGIETLIKFEQTKGGKREVEWIPKYKLIGTHTARRSYCTNHYLNKVREEDIMHFSGHKTKKEFHKYIRILGEEKSTYIAKSNGMFKLALYD